jgi:hypothetical protein
MRNNDKWGALSMKDRALLINKYVSGGVMDLKEMRRHYNRLDGTETEQTLSGKKPTLEEFIQSKVDSTRNAAHELSLSRNKGIEIKYPLTEERRLYNEHIIDEYLYDVNRSYSPPRSDEQAEIHTLNVEDKRRVANYQQAIKELENNCEYGLNCIGSALDNYPEDSRENVNSTFAKNFEQLGFKEIDLSEARPGDIVQTVNEEGPFHGMVFSRFDEKGRPLYNYSSGGIEEGHYVKEGNFYMPINYAYTYVGTPKLIQKWTDEYNNKKAFGGRILDGTEKEQTTTGLPVGAGLATYNHPKYNHAEEAEMYSYLRSRGVPHVQASAIMGNIAVESMLNPEITQIGGGGGYGLIQATDKSRKKAFINYDGQPYEFGSNITPETQRQLDYIIDKGLNSQTRGEWRGNHNIGKASVARRKFLEATDVNKASTIFTENYLRPGKSHTKRRKSMSNYFNDNYGITQRALEEFENSFLFQNN